MAAEDPEAQDPSGGAAAAIVRRQVAREVQEAPKRNGETRPPEGETVALTSITVAEAYVGREADSLTGYLGTVAWENFEEPLASEITRARETGDYYSGQFLLAEADSGPTAGGYGKAALPPGFSQIHGLLYVLGPSVVTLVLTFVLGEAESLHLDAALRDDAEPDMVEPAPGAYAVRGVFQAKYECAFRVREEFSGRCVEWLTENVPGTLADAGGREVPVCALLSLARATPFSRPAEYMRLLGLHSGDELRGRRFAFPDYLYLVSPVRRARRREFIAAFSEADVRAPGSYPDPSSVPETFHQEVSPFMTGEALEEVLLRYESRLRDVRGVLERVDFTRAAGPGATAARVWDWLRFRARDWLCSRPVPESQMVSLRNGLLAISRDVATACGDIMAAVGTPLMIWNDYPQMRPLAESGPASITAGTARTSLRTRAADLKGQEAGLRDLVLVTSQAVNDAQNEQTQKTLNVLTVALVLLTLALVFISLF
jgi:hypothetical protein